MKTVCIRIHLHFLGSHSYPLIIYSWKHWPGPTPDSRRVSLKAEVFFSKQPTHCPFPLPSFQNTGSQIDGSGPLSHRGHIPRHPVDTQKFPLTHHSVCAVQEEDDGEPNHNSFILPGVYRLRIVLKIFTFSLQRSILQFHFQHIQQWSALALGAITK